MAFDLGTIQSNIVGQFFIPFALLFAIVYGSLRTASVFKDRSVNTIIAVVIAFIGSLNAAIVSALFEFMPIMFALLAILFVYNLAATLLGGGKDSSGEKKPSGDVLLVIAAILIIVGTAGRSFLPDIGIMDQTNLIFLIALLGIYVVYKRGWGKQQG